MLVAVVDDDPAIAQLVAHVVEERGHAATVYLTGEAAWQGMQTTPYALLLIDWMLPGMDGLELCRRVRHLPWGPDAVLVMVTALSSQADQTAALEAGADDFLAKPFDLTLLETRLGIAERQAALVVARTAAEQQRQIADEALRQSEERFRILFERAPVGMVMTDTRGRVLLTNAALRAMLGYSAEELQTRGIQGISHPDDRPRGDAAMVQLLDDPATALSYDRRYIRADGAVVWGHVSVSVLHDAQGQPAQFLAVIEDVSARMADQEKLQVAEERYRTLLEHLPSVTYMTFPGQQGSLLYMSPQIERLLGFTVAEWMATADFWVTRLHPDDRAYVLESSEWFDMTGAPLYMEARYVARDGRIVWVQEEAVLVRDGAGQPLYTLGVMLDITARKEAEKATALLAAIVESSDDAIIGKTLEGTITSWNRGAKKIYGYMASEVVGQPITLLVPPDRPDEVPGILTLLRDGQRIEHFDTVRVRKDGQQINVALTISPVRDARGQIIGASTIAHDVTDRKQADAAMHQSEERYRRIVETTSEGIWMVDAQVTLTFANQRGAEMLGYPVDELLGASLLRFIEPEDEATVHAALDRRQQGRAEQREVRLRRKDGTHIWVLASATPLKDVHGQFSGILVMTTDITHRKEAEEQIRILNADLERRVVVRTSELAEAISNLRQEMAERERAEEAARQAREEAERANAAKSKFLSRMSHELRTPLNAILGFAQLLAFVPRSPDDQESIDHILRGGRHLLSLINEVLEISRIEQGRLVLSLEPVDLTVVVRDSLDVVRPLAAARTVHLREDLETVQRDGNIGEQFPMVRADHQRLKQVVLNLLANAIKYNHEGGTVTVTCTRGATPDYVRLLVSDAGPGIPEEKLERLFVPFDRLGAEASTVEGTGLGLSLSQSLVKAMGGTIGVESAVGVGSVFWVELPLTADLLTEPNPAGAVASLVGEEENLPGTVLYIEDNLSNLRLIERLLSQRAGVTLLSALQGSLGLELAREHHPDLILLDLHLPDMPGQEVLRRLQEDLRTRAIPVVVLSADATPHEITRLRAAGAHAYLTKPLDVATFVPLVKKVLEGGR